jgi:WD40 repeat protein
MQFALGYRALALLMLGWLVVANSAALADPKAIREVSLRDGSDIPGRPTCVWLGFSPDGGWLGVRHKLSDTRMRIRQWSTKDWKTHSWEFDCFWDRGLGVHKCAFAPDSSKLYYVANRGLYSQSLPPKEARKITSVATTTDTKNLAQSIQLGPDAKTYYITTIEECEQVRVDKVLLLPEPSVSELFKARRTGVDAITCAADATLAAVSSQRKKPGEKQEEGVVEVFELAKGERTGQMSVGANRFVNVCFAPNNEFVCATDSEARLHMWDTRTFRLVRSYKEEYTVHWIAFHAKRNFMAYCTFDRGEATNCKIVDLATGRIVLAVNVDRYGALFVEFSPDGKLMATVGMEGIVRIWDLDKLLPR